MQILQLISSSGFFGAEKVLVQLAVELERNPNYQIVSGIIENRSNPHREVVVACQRQGLETIIFPSSRLIDLRTILLLRNFVKNKPINCIHSHGYKANMYSLLCSLGLPIILVATCHNWIANTPKNKLYSLIDRLVLSNFTNIVAVSQDVKNKFSKLRVMNYSVTVIDNGIDIDLYQKKIRSTELKTNLKMKKSSLVIGIVGRISEEKGHEYLLRAYLNLSNEFPDLTLLIVGDGNLRATLQKKYDDRSIIFTGIRDDLPALYQCMDIFVLPSLQEGLPMVLLEAMAARLPVVATRVGEVPRVVVNQQTGLLIRPADGKELESALRFLLANRDKSRRMGILGYERVKKHFSARKMASKYAKIYQTQKRDQ